MFRKLIVTAISLLFITSIYAQNLQLHYDARHSLYGNDAAPTDYLTATFEMFKPDKWGQTFMFIDFDFNFNKRSPGLAYAEISRAFKIGDFPLMPHIEYNGGLGLVKGTDFGFSIPNAYLAGVEYPFQLGNFFMGTYVVYRLNAFPQYSHDVQWTVTWNSTLANGKLSLAGFADIWTEDKKFSEGADATGKKFIFISEPQIWYNITEHFSIGGEVELSYNFVNKFNESKFYAIPTLATKWNF